LSPSPTASRSGFAHFHPRNASITPQPPRAKSQAVKICLLVAFWAIATAAVPVPWEVIFGKAAAPALQVQANIRENVWGSTFTNCSSGAVEASMNSVRTALLTFKGTTGRYPTAAEGLQALVTRPPGLANWRQAIMKIDPDPWGRPYQYVVPSPNGVGPFGIYSFGEDGISHSGGNDRDDVNTWNEDRPWAKSSRALPIACGTAALLAMGVLVFKTIRFNPGNPVPVAIP
jgi:type II secretion system protein G